MKRGKEVSVDLAEDYTVRFGTVDNKNPKTIYIQISSWGKPLEEREGDYDRILKNKSKRVKQKIYNTISESDFDKRRIIVDFNMASSGINYEKRSFMCVEATLFQKNLLPINSDELQPILKEISDKLIKDVFDVDEHFKFFKRKN